MLAFYWEMTAGTIQGIIKQRRLMRGLTLGRLGVISGVSPSHLGRIERGERFPSARVLRKIAQPLGLGEAELFTFAGYLPAASDDAKVQNNGGKIDPYVAALLSSEPIEMQRALVGLLSIMKCLTGVRNGDA